MKFKNIDSCGMLLSAIHNVNGEEKLNLVMLDDAIPAGAKLYEEYKCHSHFPSLDASQIL